MSETPRSAAPRRKSSLAIISNIFSSKSIDNDSSEDENNEDHIDKLIAEGARGIISFKVYCVLTDTAKSLHIVLYNGQIYQINHKNQRKIISCKDINSITIRPDHNVITEIKKSRNMSTREKRYIFQTDENALQYKRYVDTIKSNGHLISRAFDIFDRKGDGILNSLSVEFALKCFDINATQEDVRNMLKVSDENYFDFHSFFHILWEMPITSTRDCLLVWLRNSETFKSNRIALGEEYIVGTLDAVDAPCYFEALPGEVVVKKIENAFYSIVADAKSNTTIFSSPGSMHISVYRIALTSSKRTSYSGDHYHSRYDDIPFFNSISIPLCNIHKIFISQPNSTINVICKDFRHIRISLEKDEELKVEGLTQLIELMIFNRNYIEYENPYGHIFAFKYHNLFSHDGWDFSDMRSEYIRQGLDDEAKWQIVDNSDFTMVDTYPAFFVLPAAISFQEIIVAINYRSKGRLPAVTYRHRNTGAVLTRSAQPLVGLTTKKCPADEKMLDLYRLKGISNDPNEFELPSKFYILDARRQIAATLNKAAGKGTEDISTYHNTDLVFCDIDNIHVMRTSAQNFSDLLNQSSATLDSTLNLSSTSYGNTTSVTSSENGLHSGAGFFQKIEDSGWMKHIRLILKAGVLGAEKLHLEGASVLVHCSDGWDRTAQICSITQIILDPYFRTIEGLAVLIEKDWCSFGFKFQDRCGHGEDASFYPEERSPIYLQFLDTLHQILLQFPKAFQYNQYFLVFLADHLYSGLFGNFLGNYDHHRQLLNVKENTHSIWSYVLQQENLPRFLNSDYQPTTRPIWPSSAMTKLRIWGRYFSRWDPESHPNRLSGEEWLDDWGKGFEAKGLKAMPSSYQYRGSVRFTARSWGIATQDEINLFKNTPQQSTDFDQDQDQENVDDADENFATTLDMSDAVDDHISIGNDGSIGLVNDETGSDKSGDHTEDELRDEFYDCEAGGFESNHEYYEEEVPEEFEDGEENEPLEDVDEDDFDNQDDEAQSDDAMHRDILELQEQSMVAESDTDELMQELSLSDNLLDSPSIIALEELIDNDPNKGNIDLTRATILDITGTSTSTVQQPLSPKKNRLSRKKKSTKHRKTRSDTSA